MVQISSSALSSTTGGMGALTGLFQGLQTGFIQGRQLAQQQNLLRLQQEAGQRAEQGLDLERQRLGLIAGQQAFQQSEVQRRVKQEETDSEIIGRASELIANAGDASAVDRFVATHQARAAGTPFGGAAPNVLDPRLRSAYRRSQVHQLDEATKGASPEVRQFLFDRYSTAAKESEKQRGRQHLAERASQMLKAWNEGATEIGDKPPSWVTDIPEAVLEAIKENPEGFDDEALNGALELGGKAYSAWLGPRAQARSLAERAKTTINGLEGAHPAVGALASTDIALMSQGLMDPEAFSEKMGYYAHGFIPVEFGGKIVGSARTPAEAQNLQAMFEERQALVNDRMRSEAEEARAHADYWKMGGRGSSASGQPTPEDVGRMLMAEETKVRAEQERMYRTVPGGKAAKPAILRAFGLPAPLTDEEIKAEARKRVGGSLSSAGVSPAVVDSISSGRFEGMAGRSGQPMFDVLPPDEQQASKVRGLLGEVYSKGMTYEQAKAYLEAAGLDLNEQYMMSEELPKMLDTLRIMQASGIQVPR